ncbi:hypothetical protein [Actinoplanes sp. NPDC020271]|uniref:hypothetical protein n=1 Tax=Actinoplanes sp. NPDC020271 TaxID=3363896 RepID=UPI0037AFB4B1
MDDTDSPAFTGRDGAAWYISLFGGLKRRGEWKMPRDMRFVGTVGGVNLDLSEAGLEKGEPYWLTEFSLVGGVSLQVPAGVSVVPEGFRIFGPVRNAAPVRGGDEIVVRVRAFGLVGGIHVERV